MARSAMRFIACAGVLATGLLMSGVASADTPDAAADGPESASLTSNADSGSDGGGGATGASNSDPPKSTIGNGRDDVDVKPTQEEKKNRDSSVSAKKFKGALRIPILRIPARTELPASGYLDPALFFTTLVIPVPTLGEVLAVMQPAPSPVPGPAFRTQEEAPPVVDSGGGGGVNPLAAGAVAEPPVLHAPMVIAPLPVPVPPVVSPVAPLGTAAAAGPARVTPDVGAAGARTPLIRASLSSTAERPASTVTSMSGQPTRLGYPRALRNPTPGELALVALPGIAGLLMFTFSGGLIGYRQANSSRMLRAQSAARFLR
jgi:hypothetical protein